MEVPRIEWMFNEVPVPEADPGDVVVVHTSAGVLRLALCEEVAQGQWTTLDIDRAVDDVVARFRQ